jgi:hypothetical protein
VEFFAITFNSRFVERAQMLCYGVIDLFVFSHEGSVKIVSCLVYLSIILRFSKLLKSFSIKPAFFLVRY